jgi:hypothetical protein
MARKMSATSRDPEDWARATVRARATREEAAEEVAGVIADQVRELIVSGDLMGGKALVAKRLKQVVTAEQREDKDALRAAWMDLAVAAGACVAAIDFVPPSPVVARNGSAVEEDVPSGT